MAIADGGGKGEAVDEGVALAPHLGKSGSSKGFHWSFKTDLTLLIISRVYHIQ